MNILVLILSFISIGLKAATLILIATNNMRQNLWICWVIIALDGFRMLYYLLTSAYISAILAAATGLCWLIIWFMYKREK